METPALEVRSRTGWTGTVVLARKVQTLPPLEVEGEREISWRLEGFEFRRKHGLGVYLTQAEIKQRNARGPLDLLKGIAGVRVFLDHGGGTRVEFTRCRESPQKATDDPSPSSKIAYWVDGVRYRGGLPGYISPAAIVGMEIYRGVAELPAEFLDDACAAVVIWTR